MKTIKVVVERWLEVPDEWDLVEPEFTGQLHIRAEGRDMIPELTWLRLKDNSEETCGWEEVDSEDRSSIAERMVAGASSMAFVEEDSGA